MVIYTMGFTRKSAADFFGILRRERIGRLIDVRLHNVSQLAGFAKRDDLAFFLRELCDADYVHEPLLTPAPGTLKDYRSGKIGWEGYRDDYLRLVAERAVESTVDWDGLLDRRAVLLCSEPSAETCHRRLIIEYLQGHDFDVEPEHL